MTEHEHRLIVSREAMSWLRTPYVSEGRIKGACADCTFFAQMFEDLGIMPHVEIPKYSPQAHLNREMVVYLELVQDHAREVETPDVGDIVLYKIGRGWSHGGIVVEPGWPHIVHADLAAGAVVMARGDQAALASVPRRYFSPWPIRG